MYSFEETQVPNNLQKIDGGNLTRYGDIEPFVNLHAMQKTSLQEDREDFC